MASREQHIRDALAGVFATTPLTVHIYLGGLPETFDDRARFMAEWHLRTHGYRERSTEPRGSQTRRVIWVRSQEPGDLWPEDDPYMRPDAENDRIAMRVEGNVERAVKDCAQAVLRSVIEATPVDTGFARSNWTPELDRAFEGLFPARVPGEAGSTAEANAAAAIEAGVPTIETFDVHQNELIHITNNAPHIRSLNDGHSKQAPAGFVKIAVMEGLATVRNAKILEE